MSGAATIIYPARRGAQSALAANLLLQRPTAGRVVLDGRDLTAMDPRQLLAMRRDMQIVFQDPFASLSPRRTVAQTIREPLDVHGIGIARALALNPKLIVADEPVSALDVSVRAQVLNLIAALQREHGIAFLFISHDLSVVEHVSDDLGVMYLGKLVETAAAKDICRDPRHPYTQALLSAIPVPDPQRKSKRIVLAGDVPSPMNPPSGCPFHPRCPRVMAACSQVAPPVVDVGSAGQTHRVACHLYT